MNFDPLPSEILSDMTACVVTGWRSSQTSPIHSPAGRIQLMWTLARSRSSCRPQESAATLPVATTTTSGSVALTSSTLDEPREATGALRMPTEGWSRWKRKGHWSGSTQRL